MKRWLGGSRFKHRWWLAAISILLVSAGLGKNDHPQPMLRQDAESAHFRILVFSRTAAFRHDSIPDGVNAIRSLGARFGFSVDSTEDASHLNDAELAHYAAVVFLSTTGDVLDDAQQAAFERYIRSGGGYVGIHAASDTEYDWPWYAGLVGAQFMRHPAVQAARLHVEHHGHPSSNGLPLTWTRTDEWYDFRSNPRATVRVLARLDESTYEGGGMGADHPIAWYHAYDGGRAWYTAGGHTRESFREPLFVDHILGGILYAAGVAPSALGVQAGPPEDAQVLFDGAATSAWWTREGAGRVSWPVVNGALEVLPGSGDIRTLDTFQDFHLHLEFWLPTGPPDASEQDRANSGVYLQGRYEVQVLDSFGRPLAGQDDAGALYALRDADENVALPAENWQSYDVIFRAARFSHGVKTENARVTLWWNGSLVQDAVQLPAPTPGGDAEGEAAGPIVLQDHRQPVRYRNIWLQRLS